MSYGPPSQNIKAERFSAFQLLLQQLVPYTTNIVSVQRMMQSPNDDMLLKEAIKPDPSGGKVTRTNDIAVQTQYLYVRVVKARNLGAKDDTAGSCDPYAEVRLGKYKETTRHFEKNFDPQWNQVFAFTKDRINKASVVEVTIKDKDMVKDDFMGWVLFDLTEVPKSAPLDSPLAPVWYRLEDRKGNKLQGFIMLAVWWGTQVDEALREAWHADDDGDALANNIRSKVYLSPTLWYLRVNVIEAKDLVPGDITKTPELVVKATLGFQTSRTRVSTSRSIDPKWNEDLMFVAAEPFEEPLILSVEDKSAPYNSKVFGMCAIPLQNVERRLDDKAINNTRWFNLEKDNVTIDVENEKEVKLASRLHTRICLEGGYHVLDESTHFCSDFRPTAKKLWKKSIGVLEVGILGASGLLPMKKKDGRGTTDAYCVAKYGKKWVRTKTVTDSLSPKWNEQCTWEVFDPCTVVTIGVFDNCHLAGGEYKSGGGTMDSNIGKVRIRLSTIETDCIYTHAYSLLVLRPSGVKKMGEIHLAVRFTCSSLLNMMHMYSQPLLPKMHIHPLTVRQLDMLRHNATQIVAMRLSRAEPPLRKEVVECMLDVGCHMFSIRKSRANFFRIVEVLSGLIAAIKWFDDIRNWKNPIATALVHIVFVILVLYPVFILPSVCLSLLSVGVWNYKYWRPRSPPHVDTRLSYADNAHPDELDEEFDDFPTSRPPDVVRMRYDRLRSVCGRLQTVAGDIAIHGERLLSLLSWRDTRATTLFIIFCLIAAIVLYAKPFYVVVIQTGFTVLSHPRFQHNLPLVPLNFFRRLPSKYDCMI
uniref:C2 domain-containing protein n=2 Tax=Lactuca sativa TaxID=4236 RepID=A0A9R1URB2_LACSA|nr:hypothetical protein LSAT_V11C800420510 [Lactuca sativa]